MAAPRRAARAPIPRPGPPRSMRSSSTLARAGGRRPPRGRRPAAPPAGRPVTPVSPLPPRHGLDAVRLCTPVDRPLVHHARPPGRPPRAPRRARASTRCSRGADRRADGAGRPGRRRTSRGCSCGSTASCPTRRRCPSRSASCTATSDIVVADKPHFLATIPRGSHVVETALVRLRRELDLPELSPAHRLDRAHGGPAALRRAARAPRRVPDAVPRPAGAQDLRGRRPVRPGARAAAHGAQPDRQGARGDPRPRGAGPPNAETQVELLEHRAGLGRYRLLPATGRTHQLRVHMSGARACRSSATASTDGVGRARGLRPRRLDLPAATARGHLGVPRSARPARSRAFASRRTLQAFADPAGWATGPTPDRSAQQVRLSSKE